MRVEEFVNLVQRHAPDAEDLVDYGLELDQIDGILETFRCQHRSTSVDAGRSKSELERLVREYDCSALEISLVRFAEAPAPYAGSGVLVAFWEADPIVVLSTNEVVAFDHADPRSSTPCAVDSEHFLDALACLVEARANKDQWRGRASELGAICADRAGGGRFGGFFCSLTAFLD